MHYAVIFLCLGIGFAVAGVRLGGLGYLLLWPAASALLVGLGYAGLGGRVLGKRPDGRFAAWGYLIHLPHLLITLAVWYVQRWAIPENPADQVAPGIWVGRRPLCHEIPPGCACVVDLTAEFWTAKGVCGGVNGTPVRKYLCRPVMDGHVADDRTFVKTVREVAAIDGELYVHCAQGHGRSAALAAGLMIARGLVGDVDEAETRMIASRAKVRLTGSQRELVRRVTEELRSNHPSTD